jgi:molecular chaperone HscB
MTDYFALLGETPRPWIDTDALKEKFLALSSQFHPDRVHQAPEAERRAADERFAELNTAYNCLREPKKRLRHLLELERGAKPVDIQAVPQELMDFFFEIGKVLRSADELLKEKGRASSPVLKVQMFERAQEMTDQLNATQQKINASRDALFGELKEMNAERDSQSASSLDRLEDIYRLLGYYSRWSEQLRERVSQLAF